MDLPSPNGLVPHCYFYCYFARILGRALTPEFNAEENKLDWLIIKLINSSSVLRFPRQSSTYSIMTKHCKGDLGYVEMLMQGSGLDSSTQEGSLFDEYEGLRLMLRWHDGHIVTEQSEESSRNHEKMDSQYFKDKLYDEAKRKECVDAAAEASSLMWNAAPYDSTQALTTTKHVSSTMREMAQAKKHLDSDCLRLRLDDIPIRIASKKENNKKPDYVSEWCFDYAKQFVHQQWFTEDEKPSVLVKTSSGPSTSETPKVLAPGMYNLGSKYIPPPKRANWVKPTPLPKKKQVTFSEPPRPSLKPTQKPVVHPKKQTNACVPMSTGVKPTYGASENVPKRGPRES
ncbi:hypothetical protein Tco_1044445 [Tanacetum coccineum]|uniref:Uncharacterized protein n=1 Tax=Tanacetum coccineum TaxID=301880 RepID=A0ABQ5GPX7_9ASTR